MNLIPVVMRLASCWRWKKLALILFTWRQQGTEELVTGFDGVMTQRGNMGRAGRATVTDEQFVFEFADSEET